MAIGAVVRPFSSSKLSDIITTYAVDCHILHRQCGGDCHCVSCMHDEMCVGCVVKYNVDSDI